MNMFIKFSRMVLLTLVLVTSLNSYAQRQDTRGGGSPGPFEDANQKVELADGENYYLEGEIYEKSNGDLLFGIDFNAHPWLANKYRKAKGYYVINESKSKISLDRYIDKRVVANFKAKSVVFEDSKGNVRTDIELKPTSTPEILKK